MTIRGGFVTKLNSEYFLIAPQGAFKISRVAGVSVDDADFVAYHKLTPSEISKIEAASK